MVEIQLTMPLSYTEEQIKLAIQNHIPITDEELHAFCVRREELVTDERPHLYYRLRIGVTSTADKEQGLLKMRKQVRPVLPLLYCTRRAMPSMRPIVVGAGPCGLFAALALAEAGAHPTIIERGSRVEERTRAVNAFFEHSVLSEESNVAFGEGGAGTFSDGKLKRGARDPYNEKVFSTFVEHGAPPDILYRALPHVGTDRLVEVVRGIRRRIESLGGRFLFDTKVTDIVTRGDRVTAVHTQSTAGVEAEHATDAVFLATGHSARDVYRLLQRRGVAMEPKGFGIGVRIEHPRAYIDRLVYGAEQSTLGAAPYHLVTHLADGRGVYSFCMCPGGTVVAAATEQGGIVTNGMSTRARDGRNSNAALLVSVTPQDFLKDGPLGGIELQERIERAAHAATGSFRAPAVCLKDFLVGRVSDGFGEVIPTYPCGTELVPFDAFLPTFIANSLQKGVLSMDEWLPGFAFGDAVLTAPETRSTAPLRILRNDAMQSVSWRGLYPCGEGAGYGGGIVSSAVDGLKAAQAYLESQPYD